MTTIREVFQTLDYGPAPESPQPALDWLARHDRRFGQFIGGEWREFRPGIREYLANGRRHDPRFGAGTEVRLEPVRVLRVK